MISFWERESLIPKADAVILGAGIVGLSTAISLQEKKPGWRIMVVERGLLPMGASVKNAGFACFGSAGELLDDLENNGESEVFSLFERRWRGLARLKERLGEERIGYEAAGGFEIFTPTEDTHYHLVKDKLDFLNTNAAKVIGEENIFGLVDAEISRNGFRDCSHMVQNRFEGLIDTGKMMAALLNLAVEVGIHFLGGWEVDSFHESGSCVDLISKEGRKISTDRLLICNNAYAHRWFPNEVRQARSQVLITHPVHGLKFKGGFHFDRGYYFFRNVGERILFGGGRNLDFKAEETDVEGVTKQVQDRLEFLLKTLILPDQTIEIDMRWSGTLGLGDKKSPIVEKAGQRTWIAIRMGGMGVALGSVVGDELTDLVVHD